MKKFHGGYNFFGHEVSEYGKKYNRVDYRTLAKAFDAVLVNDVVKLFFATVNNEYSELELYNGCDYTAYDEEGNVVEAGSDEEYNREYVDIFQYYIISDDGANILKDYTNEIVYYIPLLDCYVWGVTHWGTSWDYVLTDIVIAKDNENF